MFLFSCGQVHLLLVLFLELDVGHHLSGPCFLGQLQINQTVSLKPFLLGKGGAPVHWSVEKMNYLPGCILIEYFTHAGF